MKTLRRVDMHTHTHYSDGTSSPDELVRRSRDAGVEVLIVTDHDSVSAFPEVLREAAGSRVRVGCGVEINTREEDRVHILGYGIDWRSKPLAERLESHRALRRRRIGLILERLASLGIALGLEDVRHGSRESLGRPHVADALVRKGLVHSRQEAFKKYLTKGAAAYVGPMGPTVEEAIETIREAGGWASLAHPGMIKGGYDIARWVRCGLKGIEAYYLAHTKTATQGLLALAREHGLVPTGGSDYHGPGTGREQVGGVEVPGEVFDRIEGTLALTFAGAA